MGSDIARYSTVGIQMALMIGLMAWLGTLLDAHFETEKSLWTAGLAMFGVVAAMIYMIRALNRPHMKPKSKAKVKEEESESDHSEGGTAGASESSDNKTPKP